VLAVLVAGGCSGAGDQAAPPPPPSSAETTTQASDQPPEPEPLDLAPADGVRVPPGFRAQVYATGLEHPTAMAFGPGGLYVTQDVGTLVRVQPGDDAPEAVAGGFEVPLGLAIDGRDAWVADMGELESIRLTRRGEVARRVPIVTGLPFGRHQQDGVALGADGRIYFGSGSTCDACVEEDPRSATILSVERDASDLQIFATGLRNPYGLAFQPGTGRLFASVNGRDDLPDENAPEPAEMIVIARKGHDYGWPDCWPSIRLKRLQGDCEGVTPPVAYLEEHSSADGIAFYTGETFPDEYRGNLFVALWGQYDSEDHGRRVMRLVLDANGRARRTEPFVEGLPHPLALAVDERGALLVADWERGTIYRIQAKGAP
jgi:glucose/arabinose dehydrogenase